MNFEVLKRSHLKRNIIIGVVVVAIISAIILNFTRAKYRTTQSIPLVNGTINYKPYDFKMIAMYQENDSGEYESIDTMPNSSYIINEEKSYCTIDGEKDANATLKTIDGYHTFSGLKKNSKCYLYFDDYLRKASEIILEDKVITTRDNFDNIFTIDTTGTIYRASDAYGTSYYFAGNTNENWVKFAGFYWRIIRINGDGTIRLIYQGINTTSNGNDATIGTSAFNGSYNNNNASLGYMYTIGEAHGLGTSSTIKIMLDDWYQDNLLQFDGYIDGNTGFCGDREVASGYTWSSSGSTIYYAARERLNSDSKR